MQLRVGERMKVIVAILAGCLFFGIAMGFRECFDNMWVQAGIAAIGAAGGLGIATILTCRKHSGD
jgi:hypothetical protein